MTTLRRKFLAAGIPRAITEALYDLLSAYLTNTAPVVPSHPEIAQAVTAQIRIGIEFMPRGFLAREWTTTLESFQVERAEGKLKKVLNNLWLDFTDQLWRTRNKVAHKKESLSHQAADAQWKTQLEWFLTHPECIAPKDHWLLNFTTETIERMTSLVRKRLVTNLETVRKAYANELTLRSKGQRVITQFFQRV